MDLNNKILEDSKVIKSIFEDEYIDEYDPNEIFSNLNITKLKLCNNFTVMNLILKKINLYN